MKKSIITKITAAFVLMIMCLACLVGCSAISIDIDTNADVTGNGTLAVQKGNYLYFVNGYTAISDMKTGDNKGGNQYSAIYRAKLDANGNLTYDEDGKLQNTERIVDKIVGFDKTQLYIFGDYIYYATPNIRKPDDDSNRFKITDFYSAKLNGENKSLVYRTPKASDSTDYQFYVTENNSNASKKQVYLSVYQEKELVIINCSTKDKIYSVENVDSCVMPEAKNYLAENNAVSVQNQTIYYTRDASEQEASTGNVLASIKLGEKTENIIAKGTNTYAVSYFVNGGLLYTEKDEHDSSYYKVADFAQDGSLNISNARQVIATENVNGLIYLCDYENPFYAGVVYKNSESGLTYLNGNGETKVLFDGEKVTALCFEKNYVYAYDADNSIYRINVLNDISVKIYDTKAKKDIEDEESETWPNPYFDAAKNFSVNGNYTYFFVKYTGDDEDDNGYYLNRVKISSADGQAELVGVLLEKHIKTPEVEEE